MLGKGCPNPVGSGCILGMGCSPGWLILLTPGGSATVGKPCEPTVWPKRPAKPVSVMVPTGFGAFDGPGLDPDGARTPGEVFSGAESPLLLPPLPRCIPNGFRGGFWEAAS